MADMMTFPNTWEEFEQFYGITDTEEIYTNGARLIPSFRVKQWLDHAQPEQRWIPVSERLPEEGIRVQIQLDNGWIITGFYDEGYWYSVPDCGDALNGDAIQMDVLAWMPLPEPYRGES